MAAVRCPTAARGASYFAHLLLMMYAAACYAIHCLPNVDFCALNCSPEQHAVLACRHLGAAEVDHVVLDSDKAGVDWVK